jgi:hypothetical protein
MTTLAMIFGMLPTALALGAGSEFRAPMAYAVIGGLITSTLLTLVVVPVAYTYMDDLGGWVGRRIRRLTTSPEEFARYERERGAGSVRETFRSSQIRGGARPPEAGELEAVPRGTEPERSGRRGRDRTFQP